MSDLEEARLETLGSGSAVELFEVELTKVIENCLDENTGLEAREVVLKVKIKPNEDRDCAKMTIQATSKLAPNSPYPSGLYIGKARGRAVAFENDPHQRPLQFTDTAPVGVTDIQQGRK